MFPLSLYHFSFFFVNSSWHIIEKRTSFLYKSREDWYDDKVENFKNQSSPQMGKEETLKKYNGHKIMAVAPGSIGEELELEVGDVLLTIDGEELEDIVDDLNSNPILFDEM